MAVPESRAKGLSLAPDVEEEDIEKERLNRILNNKKRMAEIGLVQSREELSQAERWAGRSSMLHLVHGAMAPHGLHVEPCRGSLSLGSLGESSAGSIASSLDPSRAYHPAALSPATPCRAMQAPKASPRQRARPALRPAVEPRRSGRVQSLPAPEYNSDRIFRSLEGEEVITRCP